MSKNKGEYMTVNLETRLNAFLESMNISKETWKSADISWQELEYIKHDHQSSQESLSRNAAMYAAVMQQIPNVHSVRWRVKDSNHLIEKIIRKRAEKNTKYLEINKSNYYEIITDLIGVRALHLFKEDFEKIHNKFHEMLEDAEPPVANIRKGDSDQFKEKCSSLGIEIKEHDSGYRSIHYVKKVKPFNRVISIEFQIRTVFEEGWSEVDHKVRYPNYSNDPLVAYASMMLNRISGVADEMASYALELKKYIDDKNITLNDYENNYNDSLNKIQELMETLSKEQTTNSKYKRLVSDLDGEVKKLRSAEEARVRQEKLISEAMQSMITNQRNDPLKLDWGAFITNKPKL